jgi:uncharacterized membrane protein YfcA
MTEWWWAYLALGAFAGFFSGLLGIGGGSRLVPLRAVARQRAATTVAGRPHA